MAAEHEEVPVTIPAQLDKEWKTSLGKRFDTQDQLLSMLIKRQDTQDTNLEALTKSVTGVVKLFNDASGGFRVLERLGKLMIPIGAIGTAIGGWMWWKK